MSLVALLQTAIPATSPLEGPFWSVVVPAALLAVAAGATWALYRKFERE